MIWTEEVKNLPNGKQQVSFGMDSAADLPDLPPLSDRVAAGSDAFTVAEKLLFMLGSDGVWK
jgi:hypothetical protein